MLNELAFVAYNPRAIHPEAFGRLQESIRRHTAGLANWDPDNGYRMASSLTVNQNGMRVVGGEQRLRALAALGQDWIDARDITFVDLEPGSPMEKDLCVTLNNREAQGDFTADVAALVTEIRKDLDDEGDRYGLDALLRNLRFQSYEDLKTGETDPDIIPDPPNEAISKPGEVYILGDHRLMCGDSSSAEDLDVLLGGEPIHLVNTDPPYNVKVEPRSNNAIAAGNSSFKQTRHPEKAKGTHAKLRAKDRPLENDFVTDEEFDRLLRAWFGNIARVLIPGGNFYIWGGYSNCANYPSALKECELYFSQAIIWVKGHPVMTRKCFLGDHEWCFFGWRSGAAHRWFGPNNARDVWEVKKVTPQKMIHLTEKPVELAARAIQYSSKKGENVLDLFGGSGSTLMGCEQTGRKAFLMEMDPLYCDVIRKRYAEFKSGEGCDWAGLTPPEVPDASRN